VQQAASIAFIDGNNNKQTNISDSQNMKQTKGARDSGHKKPARLPSKKK
jgi:hypothetical protein